MQSPPTVATPSNNHSNGYNSTSSNATITAGNPWKIATLIDATGAEHLNN